MYKLIGHTRTRSFRVMWMLEELSQPYDHISAAPHAEGVVAVNPAGKVPVLIDDGTPITDSTAIIQYLADKHGALTHAAGTLDRARQDSLTHLLLDEFDALLWTAARHSFVLPAELRVAGLKDTLRWEFARSQEALIARLGDGPFVMGDAMTVPDIILTHCLDWAMSAKFPITQPRLTAYHTRMSARPAYRAAAAR